MNKNAAKQAAFRARKKQAGLEEVRYIFLPKELHAELRAYAETLISTRSSKPLPGPM
jgi:hypothetical protein